MAYRTKLPPQAQDDIRSFVLEHFDEEDERLEAASRLNVLLERIASAPRDMGTKDPGPIPGRVGVHQVSVGDTNYPVRVAYEIDDSTGRVVINGVGFQAL